MKKEQKQKKGKVQETEEQLPPDQQARLDLYDWIQSLMVALVICVSLFIFAVRVIDIPDDKADTRIYVRPYYVYEDENGREQIVYGDVVSGYYNEMIGE